MQARRTFAHGPQGGWSALAVHLAPAEPGKNGFYLTLFPDTRPPTVVFLNGSQLLSLVEMAATSSVTDQAIWEVVAKIPMEPLLPCRSLYPRLRALLIDFTTAIRELVRAQNDRPVPVAALPAEEPGSTAPSSQPLTHAANADTLARPPSEPAQEIEIEAEPEGPADEPLR